MFKKEHGFKWIGYGAGLCAFGGVLLLLRGFGVIPWGGLLHIGFFFFGIGFVAILLGRSM